jgi:CpeT/CpcT family (DUF1001)
VIALTELKRDQRFPPLALESSISSCNESRMNFRYLPIAIMLSSCASAAKPSPTVTAIGSASTVAVDAPAQLARLLIGTFDSAAQSATDAENYKPISLKICEVTAPTLGPKVLYVEQAVQTALDKPYRQRLYVIESGADAATAISRVIELKNPVPAVGLCDKPERATFVAADAEEKIGCAVVRALAGEGLLAEPKATAVQALCAAPRTRRVK